MVPFSHRSYDQAQARPTTARAKVAGPRARPKPSEATPATTAAVATARREIAPRWIGLPRSAAASASASTASLRAPAAYWLQTSSPASRARRSQRGSARMATSPKASPTPMTANAGAACRISSWVAGCQGPRGACDDPPPSGSAGPRTGRVADGGVGGSRLSTAPAPVTPPGPGARGGRSGPGGGGWSGSAPDPSPRGGAAPPCRPRRSCMSSWPDARRRSARTSRSPPARSSRSRRPPGSSVVGSQGSRCHDRATVRSHLRIHRAGGRYPMATAGSISPMGPSDLLYRLYERRLAVDLRRRGGLPRHVGVILDGNRRWARELGMDTSEGHRRGAAQIDHLLSWSAELGIPVVTLWLLSTENLLQRHPAELAELLQIIEAKVVQLARDGAPGGYRIVPVGQLEALPERTRATLLAAERASRPYSGGTLHVAVGYGGREEIADAVRRLLAEYGDKSLDLAEAAGLVT